MDYYIKMDKNAWKWKKGLLFFELIINTLKIFWEYFWTYKHKCQTIYFKMTYCRNQWDLNQLSYGVIFCCGREKTYCIYSIIHSLHSETLTYWFSLTIYKRWTNMDFDQLRISKQILDLVKNRKKRMSSAKFLKQSFSNETFPLD